MNKWKKRFAENCHPYWIIRDDLIMEELPQNGRTRHLHGHMLRDHMARVRTQPLRTHTKEEEEKFLHTVKSLDYQKYSTERPERVALFEKDRYVIISPHTLADLDYESEQLHHCVRIYGNMVSSGYTKVYFLREKAEIEKPYGTIEIRNGKLMQLKGKYNSKVNVKAQEFVLKWANVMGITINSDDIAV